MSYRALKRWLGETNFELKSLILFGSGLTALGCVTFLLYWWRTSDLVDEQNRTTARLLVSPIILEKHWRWDQPTEDLERVVEKMASELKPYDLTEYRWDLLKANPAEATPSERPTDDVGYEALARIRQGESEFIRKVRDRGEYQYYGAVYASKSCLTCHYHKSPDVQEGDVLGIAQITLPLEQAEAKMHEVNAFVLTAELVKIVLAIFAVYLVVRYVITKPVMHLKKVSDAIAQGNLKMRAEIHTGDEFEELSQAFNRMLRHLVTVQEELRNVNTDLDGKVDELAQVNLRLYELNKLKDEFLATMSHELRTPLNSILGFSEVLTSADNLTDRQSRYVDNIKTSGENLKFMINDILDLAKIESGKMEIHPIELTLMDLIERQVGTLIPLAERKNIELTWEIDDGIPVVYQDVGKLQQILNNLLSNAIKFTPEGGRVRACARMHDEAMVDIIVEDTGVGIPLEDQEAIFEKFRQGKAIPGQQDAMTRQYEGTGLGLSIVKELSILLGGEVSLESEFGRGSKFTVRIPVRVAELDSQLGLSHHGMDSTAVGLNRSGSGEHDPSRSPSLQEPEPTTSGSS